MQVLRVHQSTHFEGEKKKDIRQNWKKKNLLASPSVSHSGGIKNLPGSLVSGEGRQKKKVSLLARESDTQLYIRIG